MSSRYRSSSLHSTTARLAVAGAAGLAVMLSFASVAVADTPGSTDVADPTGSTTTEVPGTSDSPVPAPTDPTDTTTPTPGDPSTGPGDPTSGVDGSTPAPAAKLPAKDSKSSDAARAAIVPDFGYNKFRVGVKIADGSTVPNGVTTLGSTITIVETGPAVDGGSATTTCTTTIDEGTDGTFCDGINNTGNGNSALYVARFGDVVTVTQTTVNAGLKIIDGVKTVIPSCNDQESICGQGDNTGDVVLTDAPVPPTSESDRDPDPVGVLPNTGGPPSGLLGLGLVLVAVGGWLTSRARPRRADAR